MNIYSLLVINLYMEPTVSLSQYCSYGNINWYDTNFETYETGSLIFHSHLRESIEHTTERSSKKQHAKLFSEHVKETQFVRAVICIRKFGTDVKHDRILKLLGTVLMHTHAALEFIGSKSQ